ncbi:thioredoxin domain-containing protein [Myxococcota bacterium]|nr:thioredoxin domain-containing protein [Myxococcota bacterium]
MSAPLHFRCPACGRINRLPAAAAERAPTCGACKAPLSVDGAPVHLDDDGLQALIDKSPVPVLVDFYADWCAPCRTIAPSLEALGRRYRGRLFVAKVDTDRHQRLAGRLSVRGIPALFLFREGQVVDQAAGAQPAAAIERLVVPHLPPA